MGLARPDSVEAAVAALAARPDADVVSGGTDYMVAVNQGLRRPRDVVSLRRVGGLDGVERDGAALELGARLTWAGMEERLADTVPALALAARAVGSRQARNCGTLGGNLGTASPRGSTAPVLLALDAVVELRSAGGARTLGVGDLLTGPYRTAIGPGELIARVRVPMVSGSQRFLKVGNRSSVISAVAAVVVVVEPGAHGVRFAVGAADGLPQRLVETEAVAAAAVDWDRLRLDDDGAAAVRAKATTEVRATTDHRATARYRRHAVGILVVRGLAGALRS
jgi:CO/xanthine dehydrogenase FAD-binding subunit